MLKNRVITALALAPLIVAAILFLPKEWFAVFWGAILLVAAWEWADLAGLSTVPYRATYVALILGIFLAMRFSAEYWAPSPALLPSWFYWPVVAWWFACGMALRKFPEKLLKLGYPPALKLGIGAFVLATAWMFMVALRYVSEYQVLYLILLIWVADAAAYFVGRSWGNTKLSASISPGKTVEGVYGALGAAALLAVAAGVLFGIEAINIADFVFLSLLTVVVSVIGDLFESLAKRVRGVKDSGAILPGHGGVLDRVDSLLAAAAVFYVGSMMLDILLIPGAIVLESGLPIQQEIPTQPEEGSGPAERVVPLGEGGFSEQAPSAPDHSPTHNETP